MLNSSLFQVSHAQTCGKIEYDARLLDGYIPRYVGSELILWRFGTEIVARLDPSLFVRHFLAVVLAAFSTV